jgi:hypothetical protein
MDSLDRVLLSFFGSLVVLALFLFVGSLFVKKDKDDKDK